jgi:membrane protease YdiL (CAAX protease family)
MIQFQNWVQSIRVVLPILFMLMMFSWARKEELLEKWKISPIMMARVLSSAVFLFFSVSFPSFKPALGAFPEMFTFAVCLLLCVLAFELSRRNSRKVVSTVYPEAQFKSWSAQRLVLNDLSWIFYLFGYEVFFRGFILQNSLASLTPVAAILVNISLYAGSHFPKGRKEVLLSIPFGILLCLITLKSGSIWCAFFIHTALALSNEWFSIYSKFFRGDITPVTH